MPFEFYPLALERRKESLVKMTLMLATLCLTATACTSNNKYDLERDETTYDLPVKVQDPNSLTPSQQEVYASLQAHHPLSFRALTAMMIEKHVRASAAQHPAVTSGILQEFINRIAPVGASTPEETKIGYEFNLRDFFDGHDLMINNEKTSVVDIYAENRMQAYSATYLYELIRRQRGASAFRSTNEVVIFETGHVLPGYVVQDAKGFTLVGLETTQDGSGRVQFGSVNTLGSPRVVDAELFAVAEVMGDKIANRAEVAAAAIQITAKKYGIPLSGDATNFSSAPAATLQQLNNSIFSFGDPQDRTEGDHPRTASNDSSSNAP